jgi:nucleoside-diphosphate-sugar epimerase
MSEGERTGYTVVVTGGEGFLGRVLVDQLLEPDSLLPVREVRVYDLAAGDGEPRGTTDPRLRRVRGDVRDLEKLRTACRGADVVIHCAALVDWGRHPEDVLSAVNVVGTKTVLRACREAGVRALVHTSTLDVVYSGTNAVGVDEATPIPAGPRDGYMRTKTEAELVAAAANGSPLAGGGALRVAVVRPACIWGEGDPHHVGSLLRLSRHFPLIRVGRGPGGNASWVYVGNVAHAHVVVARDLVAGEGRAAGEVFFATDPTPGNMFDFFEPVMRAAGRRVVPKTLGIPKPVMDVVAAGMATTQRALSPWVRFTPMITKFAVDFVCLDFVVSGDKIARELGYVPRYTEREAMDRTVAWARENPQG